MTISEENLQQKKKLLEQLNKEYFGSSKENEIKNALNNSAKKIATLENLVRFYQNSIHTFALESHRHNAVDIKTDPEHRFITDEQIAAIGKTQGAISNIVATDEQIKALFI